MTPSKPGLPVTYRYALAINGMKPFCLVEITPDIHASVQATSMCGVTVRVSNRFGGLFLWEPVDPVCADCVKAVRRGRPNTSQDAT
jgi:hypothetical protein